MKHKGTVLLKTNRLILRRLTLDDVDAMFDNWASNPNVTRFMTWPTHDNKETTKFVINDWVNSYEKLDYYQWGIVLKDSLTLIGTISIVNIKEEDKSVEVGYCIGEKWWHQGITSEALKELIRFFFDEVNVDIIRARHDINNPNSGKVMLKCNMKYEGTLRQAGRRGTGELSDLAYYSILKEEYK
jgi:ribosomal-protein-alanine N-acetyltransferase